MTKSDSLIKIHAKDNVAVALKNIAKGETLTFGDFTIVAAEDTDKGHKIAFQDTTFQHNFFKAKRLAFPAQADGIH